MLLRVTLAAVLGGGMAADCLAAVATRELGTTVQNDAHEPRPWRSLTAKEQALFDLGYAVFNTIWVPANAPSGRIDGLGPLYNSQSCDACHNSRRRGRGPRHDGEAPADLVIQLGRTGEHAVTRGNDDYGFVLNTSAISGFTPEARVFIQHDVRQAPLADGTVVELQQPVYRIDNLSGPALAPGTVLMPRMPPSVQGVGLLEQVPQSELEQIARGQRATTADIRGSISCCTRWGRALPIRTSVALLSRNDGAPHHSGACTLLT